MSAAAPTTRARLKKHAARALSVLLGALVAGATGCAGTPPAPPSARLEPLRVDPSLLGAGAAVASSAAVRQETAVESVPLPDAQLSQLASEQVRETAVAITPVIEPAIAPSIELPARAASPASVPSRATAVPAPAALVPPAAPSEPPLDVAALKARLRDTHAIGMFTKVALSNQMDDLLKQLRTHHQNGQKAGVAAMRKPYDALVLKVLSLVKEGDPPLARTIAASREALWGMLADPEKFRAIT